MMQRYRSHKIVEAGKIQGLHWVSIEGEPDEKLHSLTVGGKSYVLPPNFAARGTPEIGDYLVKYEDGYLSWSPAAAFESGYTLVEET